LKRAISIACASLSIPIENFTRKKAQQASDVRVSGKQSNAITDFSYLKEIGAIVDARDATRRSAPPPGLKIVTGEKNRSLAAAPVVTSKRTREASPLRSFRSGRR
jgi:hypothetical protein